MKLQGLSIIFGLIVIPMILVLSYYIQLQVDTITTQSEYDTKLLNSTHGAMAAFELNTANEDLSSVADSLRSIIEASSNIFFNTLATNMGLSNASKSYLEPYIPAILYTLYDGYYINSPTRKPRIATTSTGVAIEIDEGQKEDGTASGNFSMPGLKYNPGTGTYSYDPEDDTFYTISDVPSDHFSQLLYQRKDGTYTININDAEIAYDIEMVLKTYMPYSARYVKDDIDITINYTLDNYLTIAGNIGDCYYTKSGYLIKNDLVQFSTADGAMDLSSYNENTAEEMILAGTKVIVIVDGQEISTDRNKDAVIYYTKAKIFSDWIYNNLGNAAGNTRKPILESDIIENTSNEIAGKAEIGVENVVYTFENSDTVIFNTATDPDSDASTFSGHKFKVIRNSIQYNLNLAMTIYNQTIATSYDFKMPIILNDEWSKIINNVSIVSFMQGLHCGLKTYNNYAIVSSTNNELTVTKSEIFFVEREKFNDENSIYHRIDCPLFEISDTQELTSFLSKEVKYDKIYEKNDGRYYYDHKNLACYTCIVDGNYTPIDLTDNKKKEYYVALGKERYNIYKMNAITYSEGYEMILDKSSSINILNTSGKDSTRGLNEIKKIQVTFGNVDSADFTENVVKFIIPALNPTEIHILNTNQAKEQTIEINIHSNSTNKLKVKDIRGDITRDQSEDPDFPMVNQKSSTVVNNNILAKAVKAIKVIYE